MEPLGWTPPPLQVKVWAPQCLCQQSCNGFGQVMVRVCGFGGGSRGYLLRIAACAVVLKGCMAVVDSCVKRVLLRAVLKGPDFFFVKDRPSGPPQGTTNR